MAKEKSYGNLSRRGSKDFGSINDLPTDNPIPQHRRLAMGEKIDGTEYPSADKISFKPTTGGNGKYIKGAW